MKEWMKGYINKWKGKMKGWMKGWINKWKDKKQEGSKDEE